MKNTGYVYMLALLICGSCSENSLEQTVGKDYHGWATYAGTVDGMRYAAGTQINRDNVSALQPVWTYSTDDHDPDNRSQMQTNPLVIDGVLYGVSPRLQLFAVDAATGKQQWIFDPATVDDAATNDPYAYYKVSRGLVYSPVNDGRIFHAVANRIYAIDADSGKRIEGFGDNGFINLREQLDQYGRNYNDFIAATTPGVLYKDLLITSTRVAESADAAPGNIRAYDVETGALRWVFHTIPRPGEPGFDRWPDSTAYQRFGGANCWAGMSLDEERGLVFIPTGSISGDFYGGDRPGTNLFANSLIALDAETGEYRWHYQVVHHDLWDRDLPANPNLVSLRKDGKTIDAVAQITKHGYIFLFDRESGEPIFPIDEMAVPQNALPGEKPWATQPIPTLPEPFTRQSFTKEDIAHLSDTSYADLLEKFKKIKYQTPFTPPSKEGSWIFPGFDGGGEWGGAAVDPESGIMYVNSSELPWGMTMIDAPVQASVEAMNLVSRGKNLYQNKCASCHGTERQGVGDAYPSLLELEANYNEEKLNSIVRNGRNMMPAFPQFTDLQLEALSSFLLDKPDRELKAAEIAKEPVGQQTAPYKMTGYHRFLDQDGYPGITPPWGTLNAIDLNSGKLLWKVPLGEFEALTKRGVPPTGTENYGGPVVTKGGLVFIAATKDSKIRAFDKKTGEELWRADLPVPGYATPAIYEIDGKQFVVIACGGGKIGSPSGSTYVAYGLKN